MSEHEHENENDAVNPSECKNENDILSHIKSDHDDDQSIIGSLCGGKCAKYFENYQQFKDHGKVHFGDLSRHHVWMEINKKFIRH